MANWRQYLRQFMYGFVLDFFYVYWFACVRDKNVLLAGLASACIALPSVLGYVAMFENRKMILPYILGLSLGSMAAVFVT